MRGVVKYIIALLNYQFSPSLCRLRFIDWDRLLACRVGWFPWTCNGRRAGFAWFGFFAFGNQVVQGIRDKPLGESGDETPHQQLGKLHARKRLCQVRKNGSRNQAGLEYQVEDERAYRAGKGRKVHGKASILQLEHGEDRVLLGGNIFDSPL